MATLIFLSANCYCQEWRNPEAKFDTKSNRVAKVNITWTPVKNVQLACENRSREQGLGGFGYSVDACSFWTFGPVESKCEIFTSEKTTMHEIGHEMRHCFQGSFHGIPK